MVQRQNPLRVTLYLGAGKNHPPLNFNFLLQGLVINLAVTLKIHLIDEGIFDDLDNQGAAALKHLHVREKPGLE